MSYKTGRGNVAKKCLRFHAAVKMVFDYQSVTKYAVAASRQLAPEVTMVMFVSTLDTPSGGETSGGSLRSSRQAVACHPFTRSWATMPPEVPPQPGLLCHVVLPLDRSVLGDHLRIPGFRLALDEVADTSPWTCLAGLTRRTLVLSAEAG